MWEQGYMHDVVSMYVPHFHSRTPLFPPVHIPHVPHLRSLMYHFHSLMYHASIPSCAVPPFSHVPRLHSHIPIHNSHHREFTECTTAESPFKRRRTGPQIPGTPAACFHWQRGPLFSHTRGSTAPVKGRSYDSRGRTGATFVCLLPQELAMTCKLGLSLSHEYRNIQTTEMATSHAAH